MRLGPETSASRAISEQLRPRLVLLTAAFIMVSLVGYCRHSRFAPTNVARTRQDHGNSVCHTPNKKYVLPVSQFELSGCFSRACALIPTVDKPCVSKSCANVIWRAVYYLGVFKSPFVDNTKILCGCLSSTTATIQPLFGLGPAFSEDVLPGRQLTGTGCQVCIDLLMRAYEAYGSSMVDKT